jgi:NAD(P)-dependent dehydrogenase (short-subunit alcohol dehydrogenase family)
MATQSTTPVVVVTGVGPGLGASLARRFARAYAVALLARKADHLKELAREIRQSGAAVLDVSCDVTDRVQLVEAFRAIRTGLGDPEVLLYNAGTATLGTITEITPDQYEADWRINAFGAFIAAKEVVRGMIARGRGTIFFTGATAGVKAGPRSVSFGPAKFAMRGLAQSLARDLGPKGIHVAWINVDGSIDIPGARGLKPSAL